MRPPRVLRIVSLCALLVGLSTGCAPGWQQRFRDAQQYGDAAFNRYAAKRILETLTLQNTTLVSCTSSSKGRQTSTSCLAW
jgi:hypothetical protein